MPSLTVSAPAKVNLYLAVGTARPDGYHDLVTVMQSLDLADEITLEPARGLVLSCEPDPCAWPEDNLAYRAAFSLAEALDRRTDVSIAIRKRIPAGAGLGGGSADAAAVLVGLSALWGLSCESGGVVADVAASLGADVPFQLTGGTQLLHGRGDVPLGHLRTPSLHIVLVNPGVPVSTAEAYAALDRLGRPVAPGPEALLGALRADNAPGVARALVNDMTPASVGLVPVIGDVLAFLRHTDGVLGAEMAGSGSTVFGVCADATAAEAAAVAARTRGWWAAATRTASRGAHVHDRGAGA